MIENLITNFLFQSRCLECQKPLTHSHLLCPVCQNKFQTLILKEQKQCLKCGRPLSHVSHNEICIECQNKTFPYKEIKTLWFYDGIMKNLIHHFKFKHRWSLAHYFSPFIQQKINSTFFHFDYIIPIPLSSQRLSNRGYNQATLLAYEISKFSNIPVVSTLLVRSVNTPPQSLLTKSEREKNLQNAFTIKISEQYRHKNLLLVDDVITTGTTIFEASKTLLRSKPKNITIFALAKAI